MATETELKLALDPTQRRRLLRHAVFSSALPLGTRKLLNVYYDTPDLALRQRGIALRLRRQGKEWLQTVKCAGELGGGLSTRPEWEQPYDGIAFDFDAIDDNSLRRWLGRRRIREHLAPVFETTFTRRSWRAEPAPGTIVLLMLDSGGIASAGRTAPISELELELAEGDETDLMALAKQLATCAALRPESLSKAQRGYLLFCGAEAKPVKASPSPLGNKLSVSEAFRCISLDCLAHLQANESGARRNLGAEYIHQMRVALRRYGSALRVFEPVVAQHDVERIAADIGALSDQLGAARDWDVLAEEELEPVRAAFPDDDRLTTLATEVASRRAAGQRTARAALDHPDFGRLMLDLLALSHEPGDPGDTPTSLGAFAREKIEALQARVKKRAKRAAGHDAEALHRLRIAAKGLRYAIEFFAPLLRDKAVRRTLDHLGRLQTNLGVLNDITNAERLLAECCGTDPQLREATALVGGWHRARYRDILGQLSDDIRPLLASRLF